MKHLTLAIDFDGTIVENKWPNIGEEMTGAIQTIRRLKNQGHHIIIWTCRAGKQLDECQKWLIEHNVPYDAINQNLQSSIQHFGGDTRKVSADLYVDDKAVGMRGIDKSQFWLKVLREINEAAGR